MLRNHVIINRLAGLQILHTDVIAEALLIRYETNLLINLIFMIGLQGILLITQSEALTFEMSGNPDIPFQDF